jgi:hypothetical protein
MANGDYHSLVEAGATNLAVIVNFKYSTASGYQLKAKARKDDGTYADLAYYSISDAPHVVEACPERSRRVEWTAATAAGANNSTAKLWIDGVLKETLAGLNNDALRANWVKLGKA